jgi:hypothetical protein
MSDNPWHYTTTVTFTSDAPWEANGSWRTFDRDGLTLEEERTVGGHVLNTKYAWLGNSVMATSSLDGDEFQKTTHEYFDGLDTVKVSVDGQWTKTLKYDAYSGGRLKEVSYPGGYKEMYSQASGGDFTLRTVQTEMMQP